MKISNQNHTLPRPCECLNLVLNQKAEETPQEPSGRIRAKFGMLFVYKNSVNQSDLHWLFPKKVNRKLKNRLAQRKTTPLFHLLILLMKSSETSHLKGYGVNKLLRKQKNEVRLWTENVLFLS
jgi:hypothetical protein